ncbi:MAG: hypothetical protein Q7S68_05380, partial [Deltaproteobacteria bacterium]|nr:hypothetical protein [Deltaproteobacteria bacterium]
PYNLKVSNHMKNDKSLFSFVFLALLTLWLFGCAAGPATSPSPPAEIPSLLVVPETLSVERNEISASRSLAPNVSVVNAALNTGGTYGSTIELTDLTLDVSDSAVNLALAFFDGVEIPVSTNLKQCQFTTTSSTCNDGTVLSVLKTSPMKLDFSDFDLDNDGNTEGCSGNTCPVDCTKVSCTAGCPSSVAISAKKPICVRAWIKNSSITGSSTFGALMGLRIDEIPIPEFQSNGTTTTKDSNGDVVFVTKGSGVYREIDTETLSSTQTRTTLLLTNYDHKDANDSAKKINDIALIRTTYDTSSGSSQAIRQAKDYFRTEQETATFTFDGSSGVRNTVQFDITITDTQGVLSTGTHVSRFMESGLFWRGTNNTTDTVDLDFTNTCVELATGELPVATASQTQDFINKECLKINVGGLTVTPPDFSTVFFPSVANFPDNPCTTGNFPTATDCP